jgi:hypothetical protein
MTLGGYAATERGEINRRDAEYAEFKVKTPLGALCASAVSSPLMEQNCE